MDSNGCFDKKKLLSIFVRDKSDKKFLPNRIVNQSGLTSQLVEPLFLSEFQNVTSLNKKRKPKRVKINISGLIFEISESLLGNCFYSTISYLRLKLYIYIIE